MLAISNFCCFALYSSISQLFLNVEIWWFLYLISLTYKVNFTILSQRLVMRIKCEKQENTLWSPRYGWDSIIVSNHNASVIKHSWGNGNGPHGYLALANQSKRSQRVKGQSVGSCLHSAHRYVTLSGIEKNLGVYHTDLFSLGKCLFWTSSQP